MRAPRFTTLDLFFATTLVALLVGLFTCAWRWTPIWTWVDEAQPSSSTAVFMHSTHDLIWDQSLYIDAIPASARFIPAAFFVCGFAAWAAAWGAVRKRRSRDHQPHLCLPPIAMRLCWGLMIAGGLLALSIPIMAMFIVGPSLFPTLYFSLVVGVVAISRGAAGDCIKLKRTAALQLANMIALDPANVVFAAMEYALIRTSSAQIYLRSASA